MELNGKERVVSARGGTHRVHSRGRGCCKRCEGRRIRDMRVEILDLMIFAEPISVDVSVHRRTGADLVDCVLALLQPTLTGGNSRPYVPAAVTS